MTRILIAAVLAVALASPASAFCGSMKSHPQPNHATKACKPF